ncbi:MAG: histidine--tRNA ligase [Clostridiaceae bacterium]|nr:histidine--tRNA ligase [Clostridiaceae bacterium]
MNQNNDTIVKPSILSGFLELLPEDQIVFNNMLDTIRSTFESYGFIPIDTPVIEKAEVLLAKSGGETEKQVYRFNKGDNDLALRFDLTVPLARFVAQHYGVLTFPFRRYHIGKVYRGERPQKGRFREFYQCDIDIVGDEKLSVVNDAEIVSVIHSTFKKLGLDDFTIMINNRKLLNGFFKHYGIKDNVEVLRIIDKLDKIGSDNVKKELVEIGISENVADDILEFTNLCGDPDNVLTALKNMSMENDEFPSGLEELETVWSYIKAFGLDSSEIEINLKIARGLDYYTGTVYETVLNHHKELGSVCSGGRYDDLASNYTKKKLPGVGISIGLSRLFYQLREANVISVSGVKTPTRILFVPLGDTSAYAIKTANYIRQMGVNTEVYLNEGKLAKKLNYANKLGIPYVAIIGEDEVRNNMVCIKDMNSGEQSVYTIDELTEFVKNIM